MAHTLNEAADFLTRITIAMPDAKKRALTKAGKLVKEEAKRVLGTYDYGWPSLQPNTIKHKATGDSPLLETGKLRDSIEYKVVGDVVSVGSNDPTALYQELGTSRIPPRSFLAGAAIRKEEEIHKICGDDMFAYAVSSKSPYDESTD
jgi:phage gpG-like protein